MPTIHDNINLRIDKHSLEQATRIVTWEAIATLAKAALVAYLAILVIDLALDFGNVGVDDSDRSGLRRSGMIVRTDHATGLQYLESKAGHLVPRLAPDGTHMHIPTRTQAQARMTN